MGSRDPAGVLAETSLYDGRRDPKNQTFHRTDDRATCGRLAAAVLSLRELRT
jgi:hypothetical protein